MLSGRTRTRSCQGMPGCSFAPPGPNCPLEMRMIWLKEYSRPRERRSSISESLVGPVVSATVDPLLSPVQLQFPLITSARTSVTFTTSAANFAHLEVVSNGLIVKRDVATVAPRSTSRFVPQRDLRKLRKLPQSSRPLSCRPPSILSCHRIQQRAMLLGACPDSAAVCCRIGPLPMNS